MKLAARSLVKEQERPVPAQDNLIALLKRCRQTKDLPQAKQLLGFMQEQSLLSHSVLGSYLVSALVDCGCVPDAQQVFDGLPHKNEHTWTSLISGYNTRGESQQALLLYRSMQDSYVKPSKFTLVAALKASARLKDVEGGHGIHTDITRKGLDPDLFIDSILVDMYAKCGSLAEAHFVLDRLVARDSVSWNALISGYAEHGLGEEAWRSFEQMKVDGVAPDSVTFACILKACGSVCAIERGWSVCDEIYKLGLDKDIVVGNTSIDMYGKCGYLGDARQVFKKLPFHDAVSWNVLIARYIEQGFGEEALSCFEQMQMESVSPTDFTFACCLNACSIIGALQTGHEIHSVLIKKGFEKDVCIGTTMVDMYAKCGSLEEGRDVFDKLALRDVVSWTSMIKRYGENQEGNMAVCCFEDMRQLGVKPNAITFTCLLAACSHASLVDKGEKYFKMMRQQYAIEPTVEHYGCMVDLLARSGHVFKAVRFVESMCCFPSREILSALLTACKVHGELELGVRCFLQLVRVYPEDATAYMLMADLYTSAGMWSDANMVEEMRINAGVKKVPGNVSIHVNKKLHEFAVGANQRKGITEMFKILTLRLMEDGYVPSVELVSTYLLDEG